MSERPDSPPEPGVASGPELRFGDCRFDPASGLLYRDGEEINLAPRPLRLLQAFLRQPGRTLSRGELLESVWDGEIVEEDALTQAVSVLRTALGDDRREPRYIQTLHGRGYRFVAGVQRRERQEPPGVVPPATVAVRARTSSWALPVAVLALLVAVAWSLVGENIAAPRADTPLRYALALPEGFRPAEYSPGAVALSPDGRWVAMVGYGEGGSRILVKGPEDFGLRVLAGTENGYAPFFSPAGGELAYFAEAGSEITVVDLETGGTRGVAPFAAGPNRGAWTADGDIYFTDGRRGLLRVPETGGEPTVVRSPSEAAGEARFLDVQTAGPGKLLLTVGMLEMGSWNEASVQLLDLRTGQARELLTGGLSPVLVGDSVLYGRQGRVLAAALTDDGVAQAAATLVDDLSTFGLSGAAQFAVAGDGSLAYIAGGERDIRTAVTRVDPDGGRTRLPLRADIYVTLDADRDGRRLALWTGADFGHVWTYDLERETLTRQTREGQNMAPSWRPGSDQIVYTSVRAGRYQLRLKGVAERGPGEAILEADARVVAGSWSPDGERLAYVRDGEEGRDIRILTLATGQDRPLIAGPYDERSPAISPDGRWLAYTSEETGERQVYLTSFEHPDTRLQVSAHGAGTPVWSAGGDRILYVSGGSLMAVDFIAEPAPRLGPARTVLEGPLLPTFDVLPDGGILIIEEVPPPPPVDELRMISGALPGLPGRTAAR